MSIKFAVVGHPNKGKSTIVSNLVMDDSLKISPIPGTTKKSKEYNLVVDDKVVYTLIDTPGFQRPRQIISYLESKNAPAHKRVEVLKEFIRKYENDTKFSDDIELLKPLVNGAGVIYVVDASKPYSIEYENDMKILSYSGANSLAILNFIDDNDYSSQWKEVLKHYFKLIKRFNPMIADINSYIDLLEAISHLNEDYKNSIKESITAFKELYKQRIQNSAKRISDLIFKVANYKKQKPFSEFKDIKNRLLEEFKNDIRSFEKETFKNILKIWGHKNININIDDILLNEIELFSKESTDIFGLSQKDFLIYGTTTGAAIGAGIDLAFLGHTALLGAGVGAITGAVGAYFTYEKAMNVKVMGFSLAKKYFEVGPIEDINFLFILLNRAINFTKKIESLSYAKRGDIKFELKNFQILTDKEKKEIFKLNKKLIDKKDDKIKENYEKLLIDILLKEKSEYKR